MLSWVGAWLIGAHIGGVYVSLMSIFGQKYNDVGVKNFMK